MKILMIDIDTLRQDHLGCCGYGRNTSPNIDSVCEDGMAFEDYYCSDAPCLPSRSALFTGKFGIRTGVVGHGGTAADMRLEGKTRDFFGWQDTLTLPAVCGLYGMKTASISTFPERHAAWWFNAGFNECYNIGRVGDERAEEVLPVALDWLERNKEEKDWFLHVHFWDPHTRYRTPAEIGNPFENQPCGAEWITDEVFARQRKDTGFHCAQELSGYGDYVPEEFRLRQLGKLESLADVQKNMDGYDCGILYADMAVGKILELLKAQGIYDETAIIVTSDHGEDMGELGRYSEHGCADHAVTHIPLIIKWPGVEPKKELVKGLHYNLDMIPTLFDLLENSCGKDIDPEKKKHIDERAAKVRPNYDGQSFAGSILGEEDTGRGGLVLSCATHAVQRAVRLGDYFYIRTYHDGLCRFKRDMLFDLSKDPHELHDLSEEKPEKVLECLAFMKNWEDSMMEKNVQYSQIDPIYTVLAEGAGFHFRTADIPAYLKRLEETGRSESAKTLKDRKKPYM